MYAVRQGGRIGNGKVTLMKGEKNRPDGAASSDIIGVILCNCGATLFDKQEMNSLVSRLSFSDTILKDVIIKTQLCSEGEIEAVVDIIRRKNCSKILFAGCSSLRNQALLKSMATRAGISSSAVYSVNMKDRIYSGGKAGREASLRAAAQVINRGMRAISLIPHFERQRIPLAKVVLVIGGGIAGVKTALELKMLGYDTILVEKEPSLGGRLKREDRGNEPYSAVEPETGKEGAVLDGVTVFTGSTLLDLSGNIGAFKAVLKTPWGMKEVTCGAVVLAVGHPVNGGEPVAGEILPISRLEEAVSALPRKRTTRTTALILDMNRDETKASTEMALRLALAVQNRGKVQVHIFLREVQVGSLSLEKLYDEAREAGVNIVKYEGDITIGRDSAGSHNGARGMMTVKARDAILDTDIQMECDLVALSDFGLDSAVGPVLARTVEVSLDSAGRFQDNNIHLFPVETNKPGILVVGACHGQYYLPQILMEAKAAALAVHTLLSNGFLEVELSNVTVDPDKCVLCLTCIRSCPHKAMRINREKGCAESIPEVCQKCGICTGECPARAIELPVYSDRVLLSQL
ncbi:MAG: 4Fe-4S binding protein [Spirochaetota bacterium]